MFVCCLDSELFSSTLGLNQQYLSRFWPLPFHTQWPCPLMHTCSECGAGMMQSAGRTFGFLSYSSLCRVRQSPFSFCFSGKPQHSVRDHTLQWLSWERSTFFFHKAYQTWFISCICTALYIEERNSWTVLTLAICKVWSMHLCKNARTHTLLIQCNMLCETSIVYVYMKVILNPQNKVFATLLTAHAILNKPPHQAWSLFMMLE